MFNTKSKKGLVLTGIISFIAGVFLFFRPALASLSDNIGNFIGSLIGLLIAGIGLILTQVVRVLVNVAQYNDFINAPAVVNGWVVMRDICNMFFVVILLIIAFATILRIPNYDYKKWLPKLILMAVLINFSKTICGLFIDLAQVVMLTFVNAFKDVAGGNIVQMMGLKEIVTFAKQSNDVGFWVIVGSYILGLIYIVIALIVIVAMLAMLVMRIVMIWIYVVLSPLAYLLNAFPGGQSYSSKWWSDFTKNLVVGPVLAFFIWLSFVAMQGDGVPKGFISTSDTQSQADLTGAGLAETANQTQGSEASTPDVLMKFVISIGLLLGGMQIASSIGGEAAGVAGKVFSKGKIAAAGAGLLALKGMKQPFSWGVDKLQQKGIVDLNVKRAWKTMQARRHEKKEEHYAEGQVNAARRMREGSRAAGIFAMSANSADAWDELSDWKGLKPVGIMKRLKGGKRMQIDRERAISEKGVHEDRLDVANFQLDYISAEDNNVRAQKRKKLDDQIALKDSQIKVEKAKGSAGDPKLLDSLQRERGLLAEKKTFADAHPKMIFGLLNNDIKKDIKGNIGEIQKEIQQKTSVIEKNTPTYTFEARAAEQKLVQKRMSDVKDISDPTELLAILKDAISAHDKTMVKAITLKMTKDYNDNEFLKPLVGDTSHRGLKQLMRDLSNKKSDNYAGFGEQEAFSLGSQIAEINKNTNHWGATSAYLMENGKFRETTDEEHHNIRGIETGKQQLQAFVRNNNRLAYGYHDKAGTFHLDASGVMMCERLDSDAGHKNIETMNESAAKHIYDAIIADRKLNDRFKDSQTNDNKSLLDALKGRLGVIAASNFESNYKQSLDLGYN